ncbi:extracellular solute-binding protein [Paenibacillus mendelii]|uniref:Extracellular solute-binding protein n=1 Tax=Paenibacillus mendelii TaxID=206163 RepID=A0ABV6JAM4_9BACL|nr:extracellular solute-binding protein [Paenibacillus mendelii]MCQ6563161.1 extracellular solute-binding protein [Paenibacillus mendelii]
MNKEPVTLNILLYDWMVDGFQKYLDKFNEEYPWITIEPVRTAGREDLSLIEWQKNLQEKGQSADLAIPYEYYHWIERGILEDLTPYIESDTTINNSNVVEGNLDSFKIGEQTYAVPVFLDTYWFYVNKNLLKSLSLEMPSNDWTYDELIELATKATDLSIHQYGLDFSPPITWYVKSLYAIANGHADHVFFMNRDLTESVIDTPEVIADLQWLYDLVNKYQVIVNENVVRTFSEPLFFQGKTLFVVADYPPDPTWSFDWDVLPMPKGTKKQVTMHQITPMGVLATSQYKEEAFKFISFFYELETQKLLADDAKVTTIRHPELDHYYNEIDHWKGKNVDAIKLSNTLGYQEPIIMDSVFHKQYMPLYHDSSWKISSGEFSFSEITKEIDNWSRNKVKFNLNK